MTTQFLIVDDSALARKFVKQCVEVAGFRGCGFLEASHGEIALEIINKQTIDVVVTDLNMPVMDGEKLLSVIKSNDNLKQIHVIIVTSVHNTEREKRMTEAGALAVLGKPLMPQLIATALAPFNVK